MVTKLPPAAVDEVPVQEMVVLHRIFKREFPLLASLVRRCLAEDVRWAQSIGGHADFIISALHNHHTTEDDYLWPALLERAKPHADLIQRMEEQHQAVARHLARAGDLLDEWRRAPAQTLGSELADTLTLVHESLAGHLDEEEAGILPLISAHITAAEWAEFGQRSFEKFPKSALPVMLGQMLESTTPAEAQLFLSKLPAFVPIMWRLVERRRYDRYIRRVRGLDRPAMRRWMR
jgi:hemerythrin-like domain-containing protein